MKYNRIINIGLVNYEFKTSSSNNYILNQSSSSPESFPQIMDNGILVEYKQLNYTSDFWEQEDLKIKQY